MDYIKELLLNVTNTEAFRRVDYPGATPLFVGRDSQNRYTFFIILEHKPPIMTPLKMLDVFVGKREDDSIGLTFYLVNDSFIDMFSYFCKDIIHTLNKKSTSEDTGHLIYSRYVKWELAFSKEREKHLSREEVKGLIGELIFLGRKLIPLYGEEKAVNSWCGLDASQQDFRLEDTWFEIKSSTSGNRTLRINSIEQLDTDTDGYLIRVILDTTSNSDVQRITLNNLVKITLDSITDIELKMAIREKLSMYGYIEDEIYDNYCYRLRGIDSYKVDQNFPCIRKNSIPLSVKRVTYDLSIEAIENFKVDDLHESNN